jgi:metal-responsive CopG/Arc/MetJ family transcriptional regulator
MTTIWLPDDLVEIIDKVKIGRKDPTRSDTVRFLLLVALAEMSFLAPETKKALGVKIPQRREGRPLPSRVGMEG